MANDKKTRGVRARESLASWRAFLWNPRTREFLGRTGTSWALIIGYYIIFYLFLAAMFAFTMWVMLQTISDERPKYQDRVQNPAYDNQSLEWPRCSPGFFRDEQGSPVGHVLAAVPLPCYFNRSLLANCSGLNDLSYGYASGQPCVLVKINRVIGYKPGDSDMSASVNCTAKNIDLGPLNFYPENKFDPMYFPYYGKKTDGGYRQPVVAVQFMNPPRNTDLQVVCRLSGPNVVVDENNRDKFIGRVEFRLHISN
ncbi:unnamed protein product [Lampetra fluviatilis]